MNKDYESTLDLATLGIFGAYELMTCNGRRISGFEIVLDFTGNGHALVVDNHDKPFPVSLKFTVTFRPEQPWLDQVLNSLDIFDIVHADTKVPCMNDNLKHELKEGIVRDIGALLDSDLEEQPNSIDVYDNVRCVRLRITPFTNDGDNAPCQKVKYFSPIKTD